MSKIPLAGRILLLFALFVTACAPAPVYVAGGEVLPEQAVRVLDAATSTARAQATANAMSTDIRRATVEAAGDAWTATALAQGLALERDAATQRAGETATAAQWTQAALADQAQVTRQAADVHATQAALAGVSAETAQALAATRRAADERRQALAGWGWAALPFGLLLLGTALGLWGFLEWRRAYRLQAEAQAWRLRLADMAAGTVFGAPGEPPLVLPAARVLPNPEYESEAESGDPDEVRLERWRLAATVFAFHGDRVGFALRRMVEAGVVSDPAWRVLVKVLVEGGVLIGGPGGTTWAGEWDYPRFRAALKAGEIALPFPAGDPPAVFSARSHTTHAPHAARAA